jgi:hypothetical protein
MISVLAVTISTNCRLLSSREDVETCHVHAESTHLSKRVAVTSMPIAARRSLISRFLTSLTRIGDDRGKPNSMDKMCPRPEKLTGRAFYESLGSPKMVVAPMVDRSEFVGSCSLISISLPVTRCAGVEIAYSIFFGT